MSTYRKLLGNGKYITVWRPFFTKIGVNETLYLSELLSWEDHLIDKGLIKEGDPFFCDYSHFVNLYGYCRSTTAKYTKRLEDLNLLSMKLGEGTPPRVYYTIQSDTVDKIILDVLQDTDKCGLDKVVESHNKGRVRIYKGTANKRVRPEETKEYFLDGWKEGTAGIEDEMLRRIHTTEQPLNDTPCLRHKHGDVTSYAYINKTNITNTKEEEEKKIISKLSTSNPPKGEVTDSIFNTDNFSDDIKDIVPENNIISFWNTFNIFTSHTKRTTKTYNKLSSDINKIIQGTFEKELDKNWLKDNKLKNIFKSPISEKELIKLIAKYSLQFTNEYQPENKSVLSKTFPNFIYNPISKKSQLLYLANNDLKKINEISPQIIKKRLPPEISTLTDELLTKRTPHISDTHRLQVYQHVESALKIYTTIRVLSTSPYIRNRITFFKEWIAYINTYSEISANTFSTTGYVWDAFIQHMEKEHSVNLDPKQKKKVERKVEVVIDEEPDIDEEMDLTSQLYE